MSSILLVILDEDGQVIFAHDLEAPRFYNYTMQKPGTEDVIVLRQDVPPIQSSEFDAWLDDWHKAHPGWIQSPAASLAEARKIADRMYLGWRQAQTGGEA